MTVPTRRRGPAGSSPNRRGCGLHNGDRIRICDHEFTLQMVGNDQNDGQELRAPFGADMPGDCGRYRAAGPVGAYRHDCSVTGYDRASARKVFIGPAGPGSGWKDEE